MKLDRVNRWLTLLANVGVIAGIVFVAIEVRQNSDMIRAQTRAQIAEELRELFSAHMNDSDYAGMLMRGNDGDVLSPVEQYQYDRHRNAWLHYWNNVVYQHGLGMYDDAEFRLQMSIIRTSFEEHRGLKDFYCRHLYRASDHLQKALDEAGRDPSCPAQVQISTDLQD